MSTTRKQPRTWTGKSAGEKRDEQPGAAPGTFLSDFALHDLAGRIVRVSDQLGHPYILLFVGPECKPSHSVLREIGRLKRRGADSILPTIVCASGGELGARTLAAQFDLGDDVVVQEGQELLHFYRVPATPAAYHVDETRRTVGPLALGSHDVIGLLRGKPAGVATKNRRQSGDSTPVPGRGKVRLDAGVSAPEITLAAPEGYSISLHAQVGRRMLLLFWSGSCQYCDEVIGAISALGEQPDPPGVLIVGREGDVRPVGIPQAMFGIQDRRTAAVAYGLPQTPSAVIINAGGRLERAPAQGRTAVLSLISSL